MRSESRGEGGGGGEERGNAKTEEMNKKYYSSKGKWRNIKKEGEEMACVEER